MGGKKFTFQKAPYTENNNQQIEYQSSEKNGKENGTISSQSKVQKNRIDMPIVKHPAATQGLKRSPAQ